MTAVGTAWYFTGWGEGPQMMMAASIMVSIFSTHDRPAVMLTHIFRGATLGVAAALLCRLIIIPGVSDPLLQGAISIPMLMACIIALHHHRTSLSAMDAMLFFLFVMQPGIPAVPAPATFVAGAFACLAGIVVAIFSFRFLLPIDPARRLRSILNAIVSDLIAMTGADSRLMEKCRARTHHRVLRMISNAAKLDNDLSAIVEGGLAALAISGCLQRLQDIEKNRLTSDSIRKAALRLTVAIERPEELLSVLEEVSSKLCRATETPHAPCHSTITATFHSAKALPSVG
jgi:uncharacterized membrane protein YccC